METKLWVFNGCSFSEHPFSPESDRGELTVGYFTSLLRFLRTFRDQIGTEIKFNILVIFLGFSFFLGDLPYCFCKTTNLFSGIELFKLCHHFTAFKYELIARRTISASETFSRLAAAFNALDR